MRFFLSLLFICVSPAFGFEIPKGLSAEDRKEVIRTVGLNSASKLLTNPYPLGGYSGFELGYSMEFINIRDIRRLGCAPGSPGCANTDYSDETEWRFSRLTIGKGLYQDIDVFFSFVPPVGPNPVSDYGGLLRWSFFQAQFLPINVSAIVHFNQLNYDDVFVNRNVGAEAVVGVNVDNFALYFGGGIAEARGTFVGPAANGNCGEDCRVDSGDPELNGDTRTTSNKVHETHTVIGLSLHYENLFAAAQVDRYRDAVYSLKLGMRF